MHWGRDEKEQDRGRDEKEQDRGRDEKERERGRDEKERDRGRDEKERERGRDETLSKIEGEMRLQLHLTLSIVLPLLTLWLSNTPLQQCVEVLCGSPQTILTVKDRWNRTALDISTDDCRDILMSKGTEQCIRTLHFFLIDFTHFFLG